MKIKIIHENCDPELAKDASLPNNAFIIEYLAEGSVQYDIVISSKQVDIFDHYWDKYHNFISMVQTDGRANPKLWTAPGSGSGSAKITGSKK